MTQEGMRMDGTTMDETLTPKVAPPRVPLAKGRGPAGLPRIAILAAADDAGVATISTPRLAKLARVSTRTAWAWLRGLPVAPSSDLALRAVLRLPFTGVDMTPPQQRRRRRTTVVAA